MASNFEHTHDVLVEAVTHLRAAVLLLDESRAPAHIAAHVDLAINQIDDVLGPGDPATAKLSGLPPFADWPRSRHSRRSGRKALIKGRA